MTADVSVSQALTNYPLASTIIGEKSLWSQEDPCRDVQKHSRRMGNRAVGVSQTPMSFPSPDTLAASPDISIDLGDDFL